MSYIHVLGSMVLGIMILSTMTPSQAVLLLGSGTQDEQRNIEVEHLESVSGGMEVMLRVVLKSLCTESISECKNTRVSILLQYCLLHVRKKYDDLRTCIST